MIFNSYHAFTIGEAPWKQIFVFLISCDVRNEAVFLLLEHSGLRGVKLKKYVKKVKFGLQTLITRNPILKNLTSRKIFGSSNT